MTFASEPLVSHDSPKESNKIEILKAEIRFFKTFLRCLAHHSIEDTNSRECIACIKDIVQRVDSLGRAHKAKRHKTDVLTDEASEVHENIKEFKSQTEGIYTTVIRSQQFQELIDDESVVEYVECVLADLKHCKDNLEVPFREVSFLEKMLWFLKMFLEFITFLGMEVEKLQDLLIRILNVVDIAAFISYQYFLNGGEVEVVKMMKDCMAKVKFLDSEVIDSLLKSLKLLRASEFDMMVEITDGIVDFIQNVLEVTQGVNDDEEIRLLHKELEFLKSFIRNEPSQYVEHVKSILSHVEVVFVEHTPKLFCIGELVYLSELSKDLKLIKVEMYILEQPSNKTGLAISLNDQFEALLEGLVFTRTYFMSHKMKCVSCLEFSLCKEIEEVTSKGESVISSIFIDNGVEGNGVQRILEDIKKLKMQANQIYKESTRLNFPKINQKAFLDHFLKNLQENVISSNRIALAKQQVMEINSSLESLRPLFCGTFEQFSEHKGFEEFKNRVVEAAFEAEYLIDSFFVREHPLWYHMLTLFQVSEKIELIKSEFNEFFNEKLEARVEHAQKMVTQVLSRAAVASGDEDEIVGVEDKVKNIVGELTDRPKQYHIISIVGVARLGKTALAKAVFNDGTVKDHFDVRAWCDLSQVNTQRGLLLELLRQVPTNSGQISKKGDDGYLALVLKQSLRWKRYLIVLDNLQDIETWEYCQMVFPKDDIGSGIIFTTRLHWLVSELNHQTKNFSLGFLTTQKSWELLKNNIFEKECPLELEEIGMRIARGCCGIPYAIGQAAKILGEAEKSADSWKEAEEGLCSSNIKYLNECILEPTYKHLPEHLKSWLVYWGAIIKSERETIPVKKLIWLLIAERLVQETPDKKFEDQVEDFLMELLGTSMVLVAQHKSNGRIRKCHIVDQLGEFCLKKCREENIWEVINGNDEDTKSKIEPYTQRRLYVHSNGRHFIMSNPSGSHVRSLMFGVEDKFQIMACDVPFITNNFRLLKVLDFGSISVGNSFPRELELLILLRYLAIQGDFDSIPESISDLSDLETFLVKGSKAIGLPHTVWDMKKLRHLHVYPHIVFLPGLYHHGHKSLMSLMESNLQTFSALPLVFAVESSVTGEERIAKWLANVQKLRCILADSCSSPSKNRNLFPFLLYLDKLESLKICRTNGVVSSSSFSFPQSLKRLTLSNLDLQWDEISIIGRLPNLEVLKLLRFAFKGSEWNIRDAMFLRLRFLKLNSSDIRVWTADEDCLPRLERLVLQRCEHLEVIPFCIADSAVFHTIELLECSDYVNNLAIEMRKQRTDFGGELKVLTGHTHQEKSTKGFMSRS